MVKHTDSDIKIVATNRKASHEFFLLEKYEAGIALQGSEIKSIRGGQITPHHPLQRSPQLIFYTR